MIARSIARGAAPAAATSTATGIVGWLHVSLRVQAGLPRCHIANAHHGPPVPRLSGEFAQKS
jgi:hypothetical protein